MLYNAVRRGNKVSVKRRRPAVATTPANNSPMNSIRARYQSVLKTRVR